METQGGPSELRRVEVTGMRIYPNFFISQRESSISFLVLRADNLPHIQTWLRMKRLFFVTVSDDTTTMKSASVKIDGQVVEWNEKLDALCDTLFLILIFRLRVLLSFLQPSSRLILRLYAKRFLHYDILVGTHEILPPVTSTSGSSFIGILVHSTG
jgi:hypothetical protein